MKDNLEFSTETEFLEFRDSYSTAGELMLGMANYVPYGIPIQNFLKLQWLILSFEPYCEEKLVLKFSNETNEYFIGDLNDGGHGARTKILKINGEDIFKNPEALLKWTRDRSSLLWTTAANNA